MAASLRKEPGLDVETVEGRYGEFTVLVDGEIVLNGGAMAFLGVLPSVRRVRDLVGKKMAAAGSPRCARPSGGVD